MSERAERYLPGEVSSTGSFSTVAFLEMRNDYLPKCSKVLFSKLRFIKIFFNSSKVRASAEIVIDESRFGNRTFKHFG